MNCEQVQEAILLSDEPAKISAADSEFGRHVAECAVCQAFVQRLVRMEKMAGRLGLPANSEAARAEALANISQRVRMPERRLLLRPAWISAVAAVLVVGIGVGIWIQKAYLTPPEQQQLAQGPAVMDQLLDWDLALADAEAPQNSLRHSCARTEEWSSRSPLRSVATSSTRMPFAGCASVVARASTVTAACGTR